MSASLERELTPGTWPSTIHFVALSDVGMRRATNQDSYCVVPAESEAMWRRHGHLFIVADGMGAHAAGELASKLAVDLIPLLYSKQVDCPPHEGLLKAIQEANSEIFRKGQANIEYRNMGTTCSSLALLPEGAVIGHVGDSRVYQLRGEKLYQLSFDHSLVWEMQAAGEVTDETARSGVIPKNVITRSLGPNGSVLVDLEGPFPVRKGDRFLLCSDGLSGQIDEDELGTILRVLPPDEAAQLLIDLSNLRGGPDNITTIVVEVADDKIASNNSPGAIRMRPALDPRPFSRVIGIVVAVCYIAAILLLTTNQTIQAAFAGGLGTIALIIGILIFFHSRMPVPASMERYGKGPYREYNSKASQSLFEHLAGMMKSLREAAEERNWNIDWTELDRGFARACQSSDERRYDEALVAQAAVITKLMQQIRQQRNRGQSERSVR